MKNTNVTIKSNELISILNTQFKGKVNLARVKLIAMFICSLCKVQTVTFSKLANAFDSTSKSSSSLRHIQRFIASFDISSDLTAKLIFGLLPQKDNLILTIDRTNWKFGQTNFGKQCIKSLVADREFVGDKWIAFLNREKIRYHIRIRNNFKVYIPSKGKELKVSWLFNNLKVGQYKVYHKIVKINNQYYFKELNLAINLDYLKTKSIYHLLFLQHTVQ